MEEVKELYDIIGKVKTLVDQGYFTIDEARKLTRYPFRALERRRHSLKKKGYVIPRTTFGGVFGL